MNFKRLISIFLVLLIAGIAVVTAWDRCFVSDGVSISYEKKKVKLENSAPEYRTVLFTVIFTDDTKAEYQQYTVNANSTREITYAKRIKSVAPCW